MPCWECTAHGASAKHIHYVSGLNLVAVVARFIGVPSNIYSDPHGACRLWWVGPATV
jgi:hypothetical protein